MSGQVHLSIVVFLLILAAFACTPTQAFVDDQFSVVVDPRKLDCYYFQVDGDLFHLDIKVTRGGKRDITVMLFDPKEELIIKEEAKSELRRDLPVKHAGPYRLCLDNYYSTFSEKLVYVSAYDTLEKIPAHRFLGEVLNYVAKNDSLASRAKNVERNLNFALVLQSLHRAKMSSQYYTVQQNLARVTWFSLISCIVIPSAGFLHAKFVKAMFAAKVDFKSQI